MDLQLKGRTYFITGGSRGIGKEIVVSLLQEGAQVGTCSRSKPDLETLRNSLPKPLQANLYTAQCDIRNAEALQATVNSTAKELAQLDGVVANAGYGTTGGVLQTPPADYTSQFELKVLGTLNLVNAALPYLLKSDSGRIVIINATTSEFPDPQMAAVSASRAALAQIAKLLAAELASNQICVNTINLGVIDTARQIARYQASQSNLPYQDWLKSEAQRRNIPFNRLGKPTEVAPAVLFLLSPLSSYTTATTLNLTGAQNTTT